MVLVDDGLGGERIGGELYRGWLSEVQTRPQP